MVLSSPWIGKEPNHSETRKTMHPDQLELRSTVSGPGRPLTTLLAVCISALAAWAGTLQAATVDIPNGSFESPTVPPGFPAFPVVDSCQKAAQPPVVPLLPGLTWTQMAGSLPTPPNRATHT